MLAGPRLAPSARLAGRPAESFDQSVQRSGPNNSALRPPIVVVIIISKRRNSISFFANCERREVFSLVNCWTRRRPVNSKERNNHLQILIAPAR